jgi:hypothetical protein
MYREAPAPDATRVPWLFARPERVATLAFMLGTLASAGALGVGPLDAETLGMSAGEVLRDRPYLPFVLVTIGVRVVGWGAVVRCALSLRGNDRVLIGAVSALALFFSLFEAMISGGGHGHSQMLASGLGTVIGIFLDPLRALSFIAVARLTQRAADGDPEVTAHRASAAAFAWAAVWALASAIVGVAVVFQLPAAVAGVIALAGLVAVYRRAARPRGEGDASASRARAREESGSGIVDGAFAVGLAALLFVPIRLYEQIHMTRNEGAIAVFRSDRGLPGDVEVDGREAGLLLFKVTYNSQIDYLGWDEGKRVLVKGEALFARVPRTRPVPTASPR